MCKFNLFSILISTSAMKSVHNVTLTLVDVGGTCTIEFKVVCIFSQDEIPYDAIEAVTQLARETDGQFVIRRNWEYCPWINLDVPTNLKFIILPPSALETRVYYGQRVLGPSRGAEAPSGAEEPQGDVSDDLEEPRVQ